MYHYHHHLTSMLFIIIVSELLKKLLLLIVLKQVSKLDVYAQVDKEWFIYIERQFQSWRA